MRRPFTLHVLLGLLSVLVLLALALFLPSWGAARQRAVVEASRTFSLASVAPGHYQWTLQDGRPARGQGLIEQRALQFERSDLVEMTLTPGLSTGAAIKTGDIVATIRSPLNERRLQEERAFLEGLQSDRALLLAGGKVEEVAEARRRMELAQAERSGQLPLLDDTRRLAAEGAVSALELENAELQDHLRALEIEIARAAMNTVQAPARPEAVGRIDAEITAASVRIAEMERLQQENAVASPIDGVLEIGGNNVVLRVYDLDTVYLRIPIPESDRNRVLLGQSVSFRTPSTPSKGFRGTTVDLGEDASTLNGMQVFWLSAEISNADHALRSGMTGVATLDLTGTSRSLIRVLLQGLWS
jgi:hypothetical protein